MDMTTEFGDLGNLDPDAALKEARQWADRSAALQETMKGIEGHAQSKDGFVSVTFTPNEGLRDLELNPRAMRMPSQDLAETIKETIHQATNDMQQKMNAAMSDAFGKFNPMDLISNPDLAPNQAKQMQESLNKSANDALAGLEEIRRKLGL